MEIKDLFITPVWLVIIYVLAFLIRPYVTDSVNRKFFIPALTLKFIGAIALGLIYQFYYGGGDTFNYFNYGSKYVWEALINHPEAGVKLIFAGKDYQPDTFVYASRILFYGDPASYFVVRAASLLDLITFHTYSATAVLFATISFTGLWAMYLTFYRMFPDLSFKLAIAIFFIPSVFFWGSGILKDTITIGALGWAVYGIYEIFIKKRVSVLKILLLGVSIYTIYVVKVYILLSFIPAAILWIASVRLSVYKNMVVKVMIAPVIIAAAVSVGFYTVNKISESSPRYRIENLGHAAKITAEWIHYVSVRSGGSAYTLGDFDYSPAGMVRKMPLAIWVTLYRPYFWEAHNIVMLLSAFESFAMLLLTLYVLVRTRGAFFRLMVTKPVPLFCFSFAIVFAFAVGISTYNFGSLVRYKIPMIPFFVMGLFIIMDYFEKEKYLGKQS